MPVSKSIYEFIPCDSAVERLFVQKLGLRNDVRHFVKLPAWFKVPTPVGQYNPDWGLVMAQPDALGGEVEGRPLLYLVRETKSSPAPGDLRGQEAQEIDCGGRHFNGALGVDYKVVQKADKLP